MGNDGVLLVDTQSENEAEELKKAVLAFGKGFPKYIINTHRHVEHIGGNAVFGDSPAVIAHHLVPQKLKSGSYLFNEFPESTFPDITLDDSLTLYFNGDRIQIQALLASHDDTEIVRNGLAEGKDLATLQKENVLEEWESYAGSYVSTDDWIEYLVNGLQKNKETRKTVFEPIYHVWKEKGADVAVEHYFELKRDHPDEYRFPETSLLVIGNKLLGREHIEAAIAFFEASLQEFPESKYNYYLFYKLADAHNRMGNTKLAVVYCEKSLKLKPDFRAATELLEEFMKK